MSRSARHAVAYWSLPALSIVAGLGYLVAAGIGGHPWLGAVMLGVMVLFAGAVLAGGRYSETVRGLLDRRDERIVSIDAQAAAVTGQVLLTVLVVAAVVEFARGHSGAPYSWLAVIGTLTYVGAVVLGRARR
ncbi:hypothetical protein GCM10023322_64050 [Rugosimonospora acidiphila]|uniref:DUF2178 domain-containing protein n=1 Tax=Rugosimonospora acidiphila TaxID=556531 RepID=A0ABP9SK12_9ACTN